MTTASSPSANSGKARPHGFALASVMIALMLSLFLEALDQTIVGTAMPRILAELHGLDRYTWVVTAYVLATMTIVPIVGKLYSTAITARAMSKIVSITVVTWPSSFTIWSTPAIMAPISITLTKAILRFLACFSPSSLPSFLAW